MQYIQFFGHVCYCNRMSTLLTIDLEKPNLYRLIYMNKGYEVHKRDGRFWLFAHKPKDIKPLIECGDCLDDILIYLKECC